MEKPPIPDGYQPVMPYLIIPDPEALLHFMKEVLGATERMIHRNEDGSMGHAEVAVDGAVIMFGGSSGDWPPNTAGLFVYVADADAAFARALELGAEQIMPVTDQSYGRSGGVRDTNGNVWWLTAPAAQLNS